MAVALLRSLLLTKDVYNALLQPYSKYTPLLTPTFKSSLNSHSHFVSVPKQYPHRSDAGNVQTTKGH